MRIINDIIHDLKLCTDPEAFCDGCRYFDRCLECPDSLMTEACRALADMQDRCARYAEEVMMLREQLKEARHE